MRRFLILLFAFLVVLLPSCSRNEEIQDDVKLILRYGDNQPDYYPTTLAAECFATLVKERTNGDVEIEVYGSGRLGGEMDVYRMVEYGGVDFMRISVGTYAAFNKEFSVLQLPYLFESSEHMWTVLDGPIGDEFLEKMDDKVIGLSWFDAGARSIYSTEHIHSLEDMEGKTIRVQENETMERIFSLLGANTVQIPYGSVYSELNKGSIDGAENNFPSYIYAGHSDVAKYVFFDEHMRLPEIMIMSLNAKKLIEEINPEYFAVIQECALEAGVYERVLWKETEENSLRECIRIGNIITYPSDEEKARWREAVEPIYDELDDESKAMVQMIRGE